MTRKESRENTFLLLFERSARKDEDAHDVFERALEIREITPDNYMKEVFFGAEEHAEEIDRMIGENLIGWQKSRVSAVSMALLTLATYEILYREDVPAKVSVNEAIELSKKYDEEKAYSFVNGVLNAVAKAAGKV